MAKIDSVVSVTGNQIWYEEAGRREKIDESYWRGTTTHFHPNDKSFTTEQGLVEHLASGLMPAEPLIGPTTPVAAFGSCFARHIAQYLDKLQYNVVTRGKRAYVSQFGDGIVNTFAIRQQFEWAWEAREPAVPLWHGYDRAALGYDDAVREQTKEMFNSADIFIITLGLSEIWYDEPTGEVFWRAPPREYFDANRHKFRVSSFSENLENLRAIHRIIRRYRPRSNIIITLSPIPLSATFRPIPCVVADSASKAILRAAVDEFMRSEADDRLFYFPSYEVVTRAFVRPYMEERRHVHKHVLEFNMRMFERFFCTTGMSDVDLFAAYRDARALDRTVVEQGHWAVPRLHLKFRATAPEDADPTD
jgi:hypothetical protein